MALSVRRSILTKCLLAGTSLFLLICVLHAPAMAQHPGAPMAGAARPAPAPPVMHPPVYRAPASPGPIYRPPIYRAPGYAPVYQPRVSVLPARPFGTIPFRPPPRPIRPFPIFRFYLLPVVNGPFWPSNFCWWSTCDWFWTSALLYNAVPSDGWNPANYTIPLGSETPVYIYGAEREEIPQLILKDGTILNVTDYWLIDNQLHFTMIEEEGMKPTEEVIPFDQLDLQKTVDVNTRRGFRFMLRNEPFEQYVRDHPEGPPPALSPQ